ncbi:pyrroline-5-carboxylate reductase [Thermodesulfobium acidiphilum]|uniref:Pyrroline-5-carboxylate reductase n=1 Tax=Thermodesulfobium acidiphilum TaxID=1794699 RepID=A0A2R4W147_THEAF|nr:pyrroline-5-carboxylate reductase [Thermodesulfobium acidiphilum]AWB10408.1 pyrroline-5-carboxylate reductase [Thermodesulfobium acidiphilum]
MIKIGILGVGKVGEAFLKGLKPLHDEGKIFVAASHRRLERREELGRKYSLRVFSSNDELVQSSDIIIITLKPDQFRSLAESMKRKTLFKDKTVISVMAGITLNELYEKGGIERAFRVMPTLGVINQNGLMAMCASSLIQPQDWMDVESILSALGNVVRLEEDKFAAFTALGGSGPAYVALIMESLVDSGVTIGLSRSISKKIVEHLFQSLVGLVEIYEHPVHLKEAVMSPNGTTAQGLLYLESSGVKGSIIQAVIKAYQRAREME